METASDPNVTRMLIAIWGTVILGIFIAIPYFIRKSMLKSSGKADQVNMEKMIKKYDFYMGNFLTSKSFHNVVKSYISLSCLSTIQVKEKSVKIYERAMLISIAIPIFLTITTQSVMLGLLGAVAGAVYYNTLVTKTIDKMYKELTEDVAIFLQTLQLNYMEYNNIGKSIIEADRGSYLDSVVEDIFEILTSTNSERKLRDFFTKSPMKTFCKIAEVCYTTDQYGDSYTEKGDSKFVQQIAIIEQEIFLEIRTLKEQELRFKSLDKIALAGLIAMPIVDIYLLSQLPGTSIIVKGMIGMVTKSVIILLTIAAYYVITLFNSKSIVTQTDFSETTFRLSQDKRVSKIVEKIKPKDKKTLAKVEFNLAKALSANSISTLYTSKLTGFVFGLIVGLFACFIFIVSAKSFIYHNTQSLTITPILVEERVQEDIDEMDAEFMAMEPEERPTNVMPEIVTGEEVEDTELFAYIQQNVRNINDWDTQIQADRMSKKLELYNNIYFKWYYLLVVYAIGVVGWFLPNIKLKLRAFLVKFEADEDSAQLQTVMITLASTGMSVYDVLYRLTSLSTVHQSALSYACQSYTLDPELALVRLGESSDVTDFKRMCIKLRKAIYAIPIGDAFRNIITEKEQYLDMQELHLKDMIRRKSSIANLLSMAPFVCVILLQILMPLMLLGYLQFMEMYQSLSVLG